MEKTYTWEGDRYAKPLRIRPRILDPLYRVNISFERRFGIFRLTLLAGRKALKHRFYAESLKETIKEATLWLSHNDCHKRWRKALHSTFWAELDGEAFRNKPEVAVAQYIKAAQDQLNRPFKKKVKAENN